MIWVKSLYALSLCTQPCSSLCSARFDSPFGANYAASCAADRSASSLPCSLLCNVLCSLLFAFRQQSCARRDTDLEIALFAATSRFCFSVSNLAQIEKRCVSNRGKRYHAISIG
jgi:hypothetical protein